MPRKKKPLWERNLDFPGIIRDLLEWGHGSGDELWEYLADSCKLGESKATRIMKLLREADNAAYELGWLK